MVVKSTVVPRPNGQPDYGIDKKAARAVVLADPSLRYSSMLSGR